IKSEGIVPNSNLNKTSLNFNGSTDLGERVILNAGINYTVTDGFNRPAFGYTGAGVIQQFYQFGQTSIVHSRLRNYRLSDGAQRTWTRNAWDDRTPRHTDNQYWIINENTSADQRHRYYGTFGLTYNLTDELYATANLYSDTYSFEINDRTAIGSQAQS